jgi:predicted DNA-binding protein
MDEDQPEHDVQPEPFSPEFMVSLRFNTAQEALDMLSGCAERMGFKLRRRDVLSSSYIRCYCSLGDRSKGEHKSKKTGCPFKFGLSARSEGDGIAYFVKKACLNHNHELQRRTIVSLEDEAKQTVASMKKLGFRPWQICGFVAERYHVNITSFDVHRVGVNLEPELFAQETDALEHAMGQNGRCEFFTIPGGTTEVRVGVFTQTPEEAENLQRYGDVIFLDGTDITTSLRWDAFPITVVDANRQIRCGGLFQLGLQTTEVFSWVLHLILSCVGDLWNVLFTDEDSALMSAVPPFCQETHHELFHYICVWHKYNNIVKHIRSAHLPKEATEELIKLASIICHSRDEEEVREALERMIERAPDLRFYLTNNVAERLPQFADCFKGAVFTLGMRSPGVSESGNHMIKSRLPNRMLTAVEFRETFTSIYRQKIAFQVTSLGPLMSPLVRQLRDQFGIVLACRTAALVDRIQARALRHEFEYEWRSEGEIICKDGKRVFAMKPDACQCGDTVSLGLPCCHLVRLHQLLSESFPAFLINPRWFLHPLPGPPPPSLHIEVITLREWIDKWFPLSASSSDDETDDAGSSSASSDSDYVPQDDSEGEEEEEAESSSIVSHVRDHPRSCTFSHDVPEPRELSGGEFPLPLTSDDEDDLPREQCEGSVSSPPPPPPESSDRSRARPESDDDEPSPPTRSQRYQRILNFGKELARICAVNEAVFPIIEEKLDKWAHRLAVDGFGTTSPEIDSATAPRRGRPRRTGHSEPDAAPPRGCPLCGKRHPLSSCLHRGILDEIIRDHPGAKHVRGKGPERSKKCDRCHFVGHGSSSCPYLQEARDRIGA